MDIRFDYYLTAIEDVFIERGVKLGVFAKTEMVPIRMGKLAKTRFGNKIGHTIPSDEIFVVNYYGHLKKSDGFRRLVRQRQHDFQGKQIKMIKAIVVHFSSIRMEMLADLTRTTAESEVVVLYPKFKKELVRLRSFKAPPCQKRKE